MNVEHPELRKRRLIHTLAEEAAKLVSAGQYDVRGAVNAVMNTYSGDVLDQGKLLFGPVMKETNQRVRGQVENTSQKGHMSDDEIILRDAKRHADELLEGFDNGDEDDRPFEPAA